MQYFGGKQRISKYVAEYINNLDINKTYIEPFCGSCNVASKVNMSNKILNDKHPYLIAMFQELQKGWIPPNKVTVEQYQKVKDNQDKMPHIAGFVGFSCSFAGKYFGGYARGKKGRNYAMSGRNNIIKKMETLMDAKFINKDFYELDFKNSIIYCDPPYKNTTPYNKKMVGSFDYDLFLQWVKKQSKDNIVLVSEYKHNVPEDAEIVLEIPSKTDIRGKDGKRIQTIEILYTFNKL